MSSTVSEIPLSIEIKPSRLLTVYVLCIHAAATLVATILPVSLWIMCGMLLLLLMSCAVTYTRRINLHTRNAVVGLERRPDGAWQIHLKDGSAHQVNLLPDSYLHPELLVLNFKLCSGKRRSVVLARDSADSTSLRRLRVALALGVRESMD